MTVFAGHILQETGSWCKLLSYTSTTPADSKLVEIDIKTILNFELFCEIQRQFEYRALTNRAKHLLRQIQPHAFTNSLKFKDCLCFGTKDLKVKFEVLLY